jgi:hypothetical protein
MRAAFSNWLTAEKLADKDSCRRVVRKAVGRVRGKKRHACIPQLSEANFLRHKIAGEAGRQLNDIVPRVAGDSRQRRREA